MFTSGWASPVSTDTTGASTGLAATTDPTGSSSSGVRFTSDPCVPSVRAVGEPVAVEDPAPLLAGGSRADADSLESRMESAGGSAS